MPRFHEEGMVQVNNLTRIYTESPMLQAVVSTVAIYGGLAEGVGGAELREWLLDESEHAEMQNTALESTTGASDARIAELTRQRDAALDAYEGLERDVEERYMKLPEDADGVPWHIGDVIEGHGELRCMSINCNGWTFASSTAIDPSIHRHAKPDKLRNRVKLFGNEASRHGHQYGLVSDELIDELCADIRELAERGEL